LTSVTGQNANSTRTDNVTMQEVRIETGEKNKKVVFTADAILYEYLDGGLKERGKASLSLISPSQVTKQDL
jgi:Ran-binding protein 3